MIRRFPHLPSARRAAVLIPSVLALLAGCDRADPDGDSSRAVALAAPQSCAVAEKRVYEQPLAAMFAAAFGEAAPFGERVTLDGASDCYRYEPAGRVSLGGTEALISEAHTADCHACAGTLSIHYLADAAGAWQVQGGWRDLSRLAAWGKPPAWRIRRDLTPHPAVEISLTDGNHGYNCTLISLIELTPAAPLVRIPATAVGYDDSGAASDRPARVVTSRITATDGGGVTLRYSGEREGELVFGPSESRGESEGESGGEYTRAGTNPIEGCDLTQQG